MRSRLANSRTGTAIVYASIAGARRILGMAITVPTAHIFGPVFYGQLNIATTLLFLVSTLFALGLELIVFRAAAQEDADSLNATGWLLRFISPAVGVGLALLVWLFEWHIYGLSPLVLSLVLMTSSFTPSNSAFFNSLTRSRGQLETFISRNVILLVLGTGLKAAFILVLHGGLVAWMMIELVTAICGWIFAVVSLAQTRPAASATKAVLATSLPLLPHTLMHWIVGTSDRLLIASFMGVKSLGIYAATYTVPSFLGVALGELNSAFMPSYAKDAAANGYISQVIKQTRLFGAVTLFTAICGPVLTAIVFPASLTGYVWLIPILCAGYMAFALYLIVANILTLAANVTKAILTLSSAGAATNFLINILVIPRIGLLGASITTLLGYCTMVAVGAVQLKKHKRTIPWTALITKGWLGLWTIAMIAIETVVLHVYH